MGKIVSGSPADPNLDAYATIESDLANKGFYRSKDKGRVGKSVIATPLAVRKRIIIRRLKPLQLMQMLVIQMDVFYQVTRDGGGNFQLFRNRSI